MKKRPSEINSDQYELLIFLTSYFQLFEKTSQQLKIIKKIIVKQLNNI